MKTFVIAMLGVVAGLLVLGALGFFLLKRKLHRFGHQLGEMLQQLAGAGVPPFSITLRRGGQLGWQNELLVRSVARQFEFAGYLHVDDYAIPEMPDVRIRALWHPGLHSYAVIYDHDTAGVFADVVRFFQDDSALTVTSSPETGLDHPENARHVRLELDLLEPSGAHTLHEAMIQASGSRPVIPATAEQFPHAFIGAYALEMDWRIARGGLSADEVRRAAEAGGQERPDDEAVAMVQRIWRTAIADHIDEQIQESFLAHHPMSAHEWEMRRERVRVVSNWHEADELADELAWSMIEGSGDDEDDEAEERAHAYAKTRLIAVFADRSPGEGFEQAQSLLPEKRRFELLARIEDPPGCIFLAPDCHDEEP